MSADGCKQTDVDRNFAFAFPRSMVKKWQTLIECSVDVKTTDNYLLRVFCIGFTIKDQVSQRKTCYAQHSQIKAIRKNMTQIITNNVTSSDLKEVVNKLLPDSIAKDIEKACQGVYPLHDVYIRKVMQIVVGKVQWPIVNLFVCLHRSRS